MEEEKNKQTEIYEFLKKYTENKGYPPSIREICEAVSFKSTSTVHKYLKFLEKRKMIKRDPSKPRALEISEISVTKQAMISIPIVRSVIDGNSIFADENIEDTFLLPLDYIKSEKELFMFRVSDDSMINVNIRKNDLVIVEKKYVVENGDIILTEVDDSITIRRFFKENGYIKLQYENDFSNPIVVDQCKVLGKVVGTFRSFE